MVKEALSCERQNARDAEEPQSATGKDALYAR
jgi:hypothetical protein